VAAEILESQVNRGARKEIYHFRDQQGLEVDFLVPSGAGGGLWMIECQAARTIHPAMANPLLALRRAMGRAATRAVVVHQSGEGDPSTRAIMPGVEAVSIHTLARALSPTS